jgi:hypothetical protein
MAALVCWPNLMIADVSTSDLRPGRDRVPHARRLRWDLRLYDDSASVAEDG